VPELFSIQSPFDELLYNSALNAVTIAGLNYTNGIRCSVLMNFYSFIYIKSFIVVNFCDLQALQIHRSETYALLRAMRDLAINMLFNCTYNMQCSMFQVLLV